MYKCKICGKKYTELSALYSHIENKHADMIPQDMTVQQYYYYMKTGKSNGNCVMCKQATAWNKNTNKYNRFCGNPKCKEEYVKIMKSRMIAKYGKVHLLNDPEKQREMLSKRSISGTYRWSDNKSETTYTGSYELDFLKTLDLFFEWDPEDVLMPSPHTYTYKYEGEDKFYIPDAFIPSLDLEIEIKDGGDNPNNHYKIQAVDKEKERLKDEVLKSQKNFHYVKITNKNYTNFFDFLKEIKDGFEKYGDDKKIPRIFKIEDIKGTNIKPVNESTEIIEEGFMENILNDKKISVKKFEDNDFFISLNYNAKKDSPKDLQALMSKLIKGAKCEDDMMYIKTLVGKSQTYYHNLLKKRPGLKDDYEIYYDWINNGMDKEIKDRMKKLKESCQIYESSISLVYINQCLQNDYEKELKKYLNDYRSYYQEMLKEKPHAIPHINEDIKKAIRFIDGLANKGVENNLVQVAKSELGDIANLSKHSKPMKVNDHIVVSLNESTHVKGNIWIGTDWHFYKNKNNTNFKTNPHIDEIIKNHNKYVGKNDTFIFLGDLYDARTIFDMKLVPKIFKIKDLKGYKIMIKGNHDVNTDEFYLNLGFDEVYEKEYRIGNIVFTHEPAKVKNDEINIHGHIHFSNTYWDVDPLNHIDAYTEHYDFKPVTVKQLIDEYKGTDRLSIEAISKFNRTESVFESTNDITLKLKYENNNARRLFSLNDIKSEMIINNEYVVKRDKVGNHCSVSQILENVDYPNSIEFNIHFNEEINCKEHVSANIFEGVCINTLYDFNDKEYKFIREACLRLFGRYPDSIEIK